MKREMTYIAAAAVALSIFGGSVVNAQSSVLVGPSGSVTPKLTCTVKTVSIVGTKVVATGSCKIGTKSAPAKWSWTEVSSDITGAPCSLASASGKGSNFNLPLAAHPVSGASKTLLPGNYQVKYTISATWGAQKASASKTLTKTNAKSTLFCGAPPKMVSINTATSAGACIWTVFPKVDAVHQVADAYHAQVGCPAQNGTCTWHSGTTSTLAGGEVVAKYNFNCSKGYSGSVWAQIGYSLDGGQSVKCYAPAKSGASMTRLGDYGPGMIFAYAWINTIVGGHSLPLGQANVSPTNLWFSGWSTPGGQTPPC